MLNNMPSLEAKKLISKFTNESGLVAREIAIGRIAISPHAIRCPVLVIGATEDRLTPVSIQKKIARKYNAQYQEFPGAHALPIEKGWQAPIEFILQWAADHNL